MSGALKPRTGRWCPGGRGRPRRAPIGRRVWGRGRTCRRPRPRGPSPTAQRGVAFPVLLDTNVLFGAYLCDTVLRLAEAEAFRPLWSAGILEEPVSYTHLR